MNNTATTFAIKTEQFEHVWIGETMNAISCNSPIIVDAYKSRVGGKPGWIRDQDLQLIQSKYQQAPAVPTSNLTCKHCSSPLYLLCQAFAPIEKLDRILYMFGCNNAACSTKPDAFVGFRMTLKVEGTAAPCHVVPKEESQTVLVDAEDDPLSEEEEENTTTTTTTTPKNLDDELNDLLNQRDKNLEKKKQKQPQKKKKQVKVQQKQPIVTSEHCLPCYGLDIFEDFDDDDDEKLADKHVAKLLREYKKSEYATQQEVDLLGASDDEESKNDDKDDVDDFGPVEKDDMVGEMIDDKQLMKFQMVVEKYSKQGIVTLFRHSLLVIRWHFAAEPLWITKKPNCMPQGYLERCKNGKLVVQQQYLGIPDADPEEVKQNLREMRIKSLSACVPKCEHCGANRIFELQILPTMVYLLQTSKHTHLKNNEGMDFGSIFMFTCSANCMPTAECQYMREYIFVQPAQ